ncbi:MAG: hypothetical protein ACLVFD_15510 [Anaerostipes hadrus]
MRLETMKTLLESYQDKNTTEVTPNSYLRSGDYRKKFFDKNRPIFKSIIYVHTAEDS